MIPCSTLLLLLLIENGLVHLKRFSDGPFYEMLAVSLAHKRSKDFLSSIYAFFCLLHNHSLGIRQIIDHTFTLTQN